MIVVLCGLLIRARKFKSEIKIKQRERRPRSSTTPRK